MLISRIGLVTGALVLHRQQPLKLTVAAVAAGYQA